MWGVTPPSSHCPGSLPDLPLRWERLAPLELSPVCAQWRGGGSWGLMTSMGRGQGPRLGSEFPWEPGQLRALCGLGPIGRWGFPAHQLHCGEDDDETQCKGLSLPGAAEAQVAGAFVRLPVSSPNL